ncbi:hypothetical protein NW756_004640 [Fusarium oxysporum]|nr:hypothetical protein NW763_011180 [Fusarium oxysporum]KAJ4065365.1 hypothetical protein NW753_003799 [Fusarium oxysporum]KAJ4095820.1 hypothetical protein NW756_004640 [Fusarium oxysporum]
MSDELHSSRDSREESSGSSPTLKATLEATLEDGTAINLTVSPSSTESSTVTASTTFTHTSFSFHISTSLPNNALPSRNSSPSPEPQPSPISSPSEETPKPSSTKPPPVAYSKPSKMPITLPDDVVAIDTSKNSLLFYVYPNPDGHNILSYLESPDDEGNGDFSVHRIQLAKNPFNKNQEENIYVSPSNKQVRVYYVARESNFIRELCKTGDGNWYVGSLSARGKTYRVSPGTSISASVHAEQNGNRYDLRVFASEDGNVNVKGLPQISVFKYLRTGNSAKPPTWNNSYITEEVEKY